MPAEGTSKSKKNPRPAGSPTAQGRSRSRRVQVGLNVQSKLKISRGVPTGGRHVQVGLLDKPPKLTFSGLSWKTRIGSFGLFAGSPGVVFDWHEQHKKRKKQLAGGQPRQQRIVPFNSNVGQLFDAGSFSQQSSQALALFRGSYGQTRRGSRRPLQLNSLGAGGSINACHPLDYMV